MPARLNAGKPAIFLLCLLLSAAVVQAGDRRVVRGYLFYSGDNPEHLRLRAQTMYSLNWDFGTRLQVMAIDVNDPGNLEWRLACEQAYGLAQSGPDAVILFIGPEVLIGVRPIEAKAKALVQSGLERGGTDLPDVPRPGGPREPVVRFLYFENPGCGFCALARENILEPLRARHQGRVEWVACDTEIEDNYLTLLDIESGMGVPADRQGSVPAVFIGNEYNLNGVYVGLDEIQAQLPAAVEYFLAIGGVDLPAWKYELTGGQPAPPGGQGAADAEPAPPAVPQPLIHMAYFSEAGCSDCDRVSIALAHLEKRFPRLVIHRLDIFADLAVNHCLSERLHLREEDRHDAPAVFVGRDYLVDGAITYRRLVDLVGRYERTGAAVAWDGCSRTASPPPASWWLVIVPGLVDGINPCAFATIVFFVSYLSVIRRRGREIILAGVAFTLAVFLSYLAFGLVLRGVLAGLARVCGPVLRPALNLLLAVFCLVLAAVSWSDHRKARRGYVQDASLRLPHRLRLLINARIRRGMRTRSLAAASLASGVIVSFIELACTGQVYVPIIQGLSNPAYRSVALPSLVVYCLAFIAPLGLVFSLSCLGTTWAQLAGFLRRQAPRVKLAMGLVFLSIGLWLILDTLRPWIALRT